MLRTGGNNNVVGASIYLVSPIIVFFIAWLHWYISIPCCLVLLYGTYRFFKDNDILTLQDSRLASTTEGSLALLLVFVFLLITGHGMLVGGAGYDMPWRNVIYQDIINQNWPVIYSISDSAMVYYLAYWLIPAFISKLLHLNPVFSNLVLFLWTYIGLRLFVTLLWDVLHLNKHQVLPFTFIFLCWSGLNTIGMIIVSALNWAPFLVDIQYGWNTWWYTGVSASVLNGYQAAYMIRTAFDSLSNTFNQFVPALLVVILFLKYTHIKNYAFLGLLLVPFSPLGFIGVFILMLGCSLYQIILAYQKKQIVEVCHYALSRINICAAVTIFPVFYFYFTANNAVTTNGSSIFFTPLSGFTPARIFILALYYFLQFGAFCLFCYRENKHNCLYWLVLGSLLIFPYFRVGAGGDFCWNASLPGFYILMIMTMKELLEIFRGECEPWRLFIAGVLISIMSLTTFMQFGSQMRKCIQLNSLYVPGYVENLGDTLADKSKEEIQKNYANFTTVNYEDKFFFKYLAKR